MKRRTLVVILVAVALLAIAATVRSGWLYLVSSVLISLVLIGWISGVRAVRGVEIERHCPPDTFEGRPFPVELILRNKGRFTRNLLSVRDLQFEGRRGKPGLADRMRATRESFASFMSADAIEEAADGSRFRLGARKRQPRLNVTVESLGPGGEVAVRYDMSAPRRGVFSEAEMLLSSGGVFGGTEARRRLTLESPITVFPKISWIETFPLVALAADAPTEAYEWTRKGFGQDYYGVREYVRGDSLRHVHWKSTARQGKLIVKEYQQELRPSPGILVMLKRPAAGDENQNSLEDGLRAAASLINHFVGLGGVPRLIVTGERGTEVLQAASMKEYLAVLAGYRPLGAEMFYERSGGFAAALDRAAKDASRGLSPGSGIAAVVNPNLEELYQYFAGVEVYGRLTVVAAIDDSYRKRRARDINADTLSELGGLALSRMTDLFAITGARSVGECLSEPLSAIAV